MRRFNRLVYGGRGLLAKFTSGGFEHDGGNSLRLITCKRNLITQLGLISIALYTRNIPTFPEPAKMIASVSVRTTDVLWASVRLRA